jgi:hypothetical protein
VLFPFRFDDFREGVRVVVHELAAFQGVAGHVVDEGLRALDLVFRHLHRAGGEFLG